MHNQNSNFFILLQYCIEGECVPYYPDEDDEISNDNEGTTDLDNNIDDANIAKIDDAVVFPGQIPEWPDYTNEKDEEKNQNERTSNDVIPLWYDPIFTQIFNDLKNKYITI